MQLGRRAIHLHSLSLFPHSAIVSKGDSLTDCKLLGTSFRSIASERDLIVSSRTASFTNNKASMAFLLEEVLDESVNHLAY